MLGSQAETVEGGTAAAASVIACGASAVITHNDLVALGVVAGARTLGVRVPDDLSVIGIDDIPLATVSAPALTTISVPMARAGSLALATLRRAAAGRAAHAPHRPPDHPARRPRVDRTGRRPVRAARLHRSGARMTTGPVVVADANLAPLRAEFEAALPPGTEVRWPDPQERTEVEAAVADADVLVTGSCPAAVAAAGKRLRLVHAAGAGTDGIDVARSRPACRSPTPSTTRTPSPSTSSRPRSCSAAASCSRTPRCAAVSGTRRPTTPRLRGPSRWPRPRWGSSGTATSARGRWAGFRAFGARGVAVTRRGDVDAAAEGLDWTGTTDDLDPLLAAADVVVVSAPLTGDTRGLIGSRRAGRDAPVGDPGQRRPRPGGRPGGALRGAARRRDRRRRGRRLVRLPGRGGNTATPSAFPFHTLPNVFMTPHSSGLTRQTFTARAADIAANIARLVAGQPLRNVVAVAR